MTYDEQREWAAARMPKIAKEILDNRNCFDTILPLVRKHYKELALSIEWPSECASEWAYEWAKRWPEDKDVLRGRVTDSCRAYLWAIRWPEDKDVLRGRVTDSCWSYEWAERWPEDRDVMRERVTDSYRAYLWAIRWPEDKDVLRGRVTDSCWSYEWAVSWPEDKNVMRERVTESFWANQWARRWPEDASIVGSVREMNSCILCSKRDVNSVELGTIRIESDESSSRNRVYTVAATCSCCNQTVSEEVRCFGRNHMRETDLLEAVNRVVRNWNRLNGGAE